MPAANRVAACLSQLRPAESMRPSPVSPRLLPTPIRLASRPMNRGAPELAASYTLEHRSQSLAAADAHGLQSVPCLTPSNYQLGNWIVMPPLTSMLQVDLHVRLP